MKTLLGCDDVFDVLTSGPFPSGANTDRPVRQHLSQCQECRVLAEALRPARDLLVEVLPAAERSGLPVYLAPQDSRVQRIMQRVRAQPRPTAAPAPRARVVRTLCWSSLAAAIFVWLTLPWLLGGDGARHASLADEGIVQALQGMALPADCLPATLANCPHLNQPPAVAWLACESCHASRSVAVAASSNASLRLHCCTACHAAASPSRPKVVNKTRLLAACQLCHAGSLGEPGI